MKINSHDNKGRTKIQPTFKKTHVWQSSEGNTTEEMQGLERGEGGAGENDEGRVGDCEGDREGRE